MTKTALIAVGVLGLLLTGSLVASVSAGDSAGPDEQGPTIAQARFGDEAHYSDFSVEEEIGDEGYVPIVGDTWSGRLAVHVGGVVDLVDSWGHERSAVTFPVRSEVRYGDGPVEEWRTVSYQDLETGYYLGKGIFRADDRITHYPGLSMLAGWFFPGLEGVPLHDGADLLPHVRGPMDAIGEDPAREADEYTVTAVTGGEWQGKPAYGYLERFLRTGSTSMLLFQTWTWFVEGIPFPVYVVSEQTWTEESADALAWDQAAWRWRYVLELETWKPGTKEVPWGEGSGPFDPQHTWGEVTTEPTRNGLPVDGAEARHGYGLQEAYQRVQDDPTLGLDDWLAAHPDGRLAATSYEPGPSGGSWMFTYNEDYVQWYAATSLNVAPGMSVQRDRTVTRDGVGDGTWEYESPYGVYRPLDESVTLAEADRLAAYHVSPSAWDGGPRFISYGWAGPSPNRNDLLTPHVGPDSILAPAVIVLEYADPASGFTEVVDIRVADGSLGAYERRAYEEEVPILTPLLAEYGTPEMASANGVAAPPPGSSAFQWPVAAVATASLLAVLLLAYIFPWIKYHGAGLLMAIPGYAKVRKDKVLDNKLREQIHDRIKTEPGVSPPEIHQSLDAGWSTVVYHLRVLERNGLVSSLRDGRHKRFFPADSVDWSHRGELAALRNDRTKQIHQLLLEEPGLDRRGLADRLGISRNALEWHLERLQAASLADIDKDGRPHRIYANPATAVSPPDGVEVA